MQVSHLAESALYMIDVDFDVVLESSDVARIQVAFDVGQSVLKRLELERMHLIWREGLVGKKMPEHFIWWYVWMFVLTQFLKK